MTMERKREVFYGATEWLWLSGGAFVERRDEYGCLPSLRVPMQAHHFASRLIVAVTCRGDHDWERVGECISMLADVREVRWRCRRHPQHPVWCITHGGDRPPQEAVSRA